MILLLFAIYLIFQVVIAHDTQQQISDPKFQYSDEIGKYVIYRLIGNDMPPLQTRGQLRWNTKYALDHEPHFPGVHKRWILNRIWNDTEFRLIYSELVNAGVNRRDIIARCVDLNEYAKAETMEDKMFYLTSQNEGRNAGILDGRQSGFEWTIILDGNTFISYDSWTIIQKALEEASREKKLYMKIPYHRVHTKQNATWLNEETTMKEMLEYAPTKGESQVAFHRDAKEIFTLGDTKPDAKDPTKRRGYGARNKSYMFKEGQLCGPESKICKCADVIEGNEEDMEGLKLGSYTKKCGMVLRLWNYPTQSVVYTGLQTHDEEGFFCFLKAKRDTILKFKNECEVMNKLLDIWVKDTSEAVRETYRGPQAKICKNEYSIIVLTESCFRSADRELAQHFTATAIDDMIKKNYDPSILCRSLRPPPLDKSRKHFLTVFDQQTMDQEKEAWKNKGSAFSTSIDPLMKNLIDKADRALTSKSFSVVNKKRTVDPFTDKRFYYSARPYFWPLEDLPKEMKEAVSHGEIHLDKGGFLHREGMRAPGTVIGGEGDDYYDRSTAVYCIGNVTTLALAWYYTDQTKYADYGARLVQAFFLDDTTGMYPNLDYAQMGDRLGLMEWKDVYYLLDAITLLEMSGYLNSFQILKMQRWCAQLGRWYIRSPKGYLEATSFNHHGLYFDLITISLSNFAQDDVLSDVARNRLMYRLTKLAPDGHFARDGSQPNEYDRANSLSLCQFNLEGWIHAASIVEAMRAHSELPGSFASLWWAKHEGETYLDGAVPVLLKAIRWMAQFLPNDDKYFTRVSPVSKGMGVKWPYEQTEKFSFDRMLEVIHYGVQVYGVNQVFVSKSSRSTETNAALHYPLYSTNYASMTKYMTVDPESGNRAFPALALYVNRTSENTNNRRRR